MQFEPGRKGASSAQSHTKHRLLYNLNRKKATAAGNRLPPIGKQIRALRRARKMRLTDLARLSDLSIGFISQVERDKSTLSVNALHKISLALDVTVGHFFRAEKVAATGEGKFVVHGKRRRTLRFASGITDELLSPHLKHKMILTFTSLVPGAKSGDMQTTSTEQAGYIMRGSLLLEIGKQKFQLKAGDSFQFEATEPHRYVNTGRVNTQIIWVGTSL